MFRPSASGERGREPAELRPGRSPVEELLPARRAVSESSAGQPDVRRSQESSDDERVAVSKHPALPIRRRTPPRVRRRVFDRGPLLVAARRRPRPGARRGCRAPRSATTWSIRSGERAELIAREASVSLWSCRARCSSDCGLLPDLRGLPEQLDEDRDLGLQHLRLDRREDVVHRAQRVAAARRASRRRTR